jgi:hypothetical protein
MTVPIVARLAKTSWLSRKPDDSEGGSAMDASGPGVGQAARSSRLRSRSTFARP